MTNNAGSGDQWETIIRQAIGDYLDAGGNVQRLANASGYQPIAIWQFIRGERTTLTLRSAAKLAGVLGLRLAAKRKPVSRSAKLVGSKPHHVDDRRGVLAGEKIG